MTNHQETRTELVEHLAELRARLIRAIIYIAIGMVIAWFLYDWLFAFLTRPWRTFWQSEAPSSC